MQELRAQIRTGTINQTPIFLAISDLHQKCFCSCHEIAWNLVHNLVLEKGPPKNQDVLRRFDNTVELMLDANHVRMITVLHIHMK
jgi:hypothetical protein